MNEPACEFLYEKDNLEEGFHTELNADVKEENFCELQIKSETHDLNYDTSYEDHSIKPELLNEELDLKTEIPCNQSDQTISEPTKTKPFRRDLENTKSTSNINIQRPIKRTTNKSPFKCDPPQSNFMLSHKQKGAGAKRFKCNVISYTSARQNNLEYDVYISSNTGGNPLKCKVCGYASIWKHSLKRHIKIHVGEKPFKCNICNYASIHNHSLKRHTKTHTGEKIFKCNLCSYASVENRSLKEHMLTHTGEKPFKCKICDYASVRKHSLERHAKTHGGQNLFRCNICSYASVNKRSVAQHMIAHSGKKPLKCSVICM